MNNQNIQKRFNVGDKVYYIHDNDIFSGNIIFIERNGCFAISEICSGEILKLFFVYSSREEAENALSINRISQIRNGVAVWRLDDKKEHEKLQNSVNDLHSELRRINGELSDITDRQKKYYSIKESSVFKWLSFFFITTLALFGAVIALLLR